MLRFLLLSVLLGASAAQAQAPGPGDFLEGSKFYTISEELVPPPTQFPERQNDLVINLMTWVEHPKPPRPRVKYDRQGQFGAWLVREPRKNCFDTRALVLMRESKKPTTPWSIDPCYIAGGAWSDPYTAKNFTEAQKIQIDHVVALKNAYISGAFQWNNKTRCAYANFLGNRYHLLAVDASTNMRKGDSTPARWLPPNPAFRCNYLNAWLRVKAIWKLMVAEDEANAIYRQVRQFKCNPKDFIMSQQELLEQRQLIARGVAECPATPPRPRIPPPGQPRMGEEVFGSL